jgi:hypothetical protein
MVAQIHVDLLPVDAVPEALAALTEAGFSLTPVRSLSVSEEKLCCRREDRQVIISIEGNAKNLHQKWLVIAHPPYSWLPWRWPGDARFFGRITAVIDPFNVEV